MVTWAATVAEARSSSHWRAAPACGHSTKRISRPSAGPAAPAPGRTHRGAPQAGPERVGAPLGQQAAECAHAAGKAGRVVVRARGTAGGRRSAGGACGWTCADYPTILAALQFGAFPFFERPRARCGAATRHAFQTDRMTAPASTRSEPAPVAASTATGEQSPAGMSGGAFATMPAVGMAPAGNAEPALYSPAYSHYARRMLQARDGTEDVLAEAMRVPLTRAGWRPGWPCCSSRRPMPRRPPSRRCGACAPR